MSNYIREMRRIFLALPFGQWHLFSFPNLRRHFVISHGISPLPSLIKQWQRQMRRLRDEESAVGLGIVRYRLLSGMQRRSQVRFIT